MTGKINHLGEPSRQVLKRLLETMGMTERSISILLFGLLFFLAASHDIVVSAESMAVQTLIEKQEVTVGESFALQVKIDGVDSVAEPDLSELQDFTVQPKGGAQNNRESITIINGKVNRISERGYVFNYLLTPRREGILTVPAIAIIAEGKTLLTQPVPVRVLKPVITQEFMLRQFFSEPTSYVGQPLVFTVVWSVDRNIDEFQFHLPVLDDKRFEIVDHPEDRNYRGSDAIAINLQGSQVIARKGQAAQHTTVTLRKIFIPREPGMYSFEPASVASRVVTGYRQQRNGQSDSPFKNRFLDDMFRRRQPIFKQLLTISNPLESKVLPLPGENQPPDFSGLVGQYSLSAAALPAEVNVGDPITVTIMVTGPDFMDNVQLPPLDNQQAIRENFKVPDEMGPGETKGRIKVFTQTFRAKHPDVKQIPSIVLSFFNPTTGKYESASTRAIPLRVKATKVVTASDAEGLLAGFAKKELASLEKGIAYNYVGEDILENQEVGFTSWFSSPFGFGLMLFPPGAYLLILIPVSWRRKRSQNAATLQARKALPELSKKLSRLQRDIHKNTLPQAVSGLVEAMRTYLSKRLFIPPGALVYSEVIEHLQQHGVDPALLEDLQQILDLCEAYLYGARDREGSSPGNVPEMLSAAALLFTRIDQALKK